MFAANRAFVRIPIFIEGDKTFVLSLLKNIDSISLISNEKLIDNTILWRNAKQWLGQELGSLCFDLQDEFDVEKLCALAGCIKGGALVFFWLPQNNHDAQGHFIQRFYKLISNPQLAYISSLKKTRCPNFSPYPNHLNQSLPTQEQLQLIQSVEKVLYGHRRRPALILADRGRGKSAALGIAAANIMQAKKKNILVTSPVYANAQTLFNHCASTCGLTEQGAHRLSLQNGSQLTFIAPDKLIAEKPVCDLLIVDEAAAIPIPMLNQLISDYSRVVFSSTEHGYEGTGRGFSSKFRCLLNEKTTNWQEVKLTQPIRFAKNCPFERFLYDVFLFDAKPVIPKEGDVTFSTITQKQLLNDENLLKQLFALLTHAHYQTSPNDLQRLLESENSLLVGAYANDVLIGILYGQQEGNFDVKLAADIANAKRRVKGHLLPQSLAQHTGINEMLLTPIFRIIRLAVLPHWQRQNIASRLVQYAESICSDKDINILGTSFSAENQLIAFWLKQNFNPVRLGVLRDAASGNFSLQLLKSTKKKPQWQEKLEQLFMQNFSYQLSDLYQSMQIDAALMLFNIINKPLPLIDTTMLQITRFANEQLSSDFASASLYTWYCYWLTKNQACLYKELMVKVFFCRFVQRQPWQKIVKEFEFTGRKHLEQQMQRWVKKQLSKK